mmetsp:Transcript_23722/g.42983  ORF Transcript_23722/g.42983 Transcript_23722/m.42983 type:complete len:248 (+) Transcript_23722:64-807(+)
MARLGLFILLGLLVGPVQSNSLRRAHLMQVQEILQVALHHLEPDQQKDLAAVLPYLKSADKAGFKATLVSMVKSGGNERIKKCLQSLGAIGYNALEIQAWLQGSSVKAPHSAMVESADAIARRQAAETNPWTAVVHAPQVSPQARPVVQAQKPVVHVQQPLANAITAQSQPLVKPQAVTQKFVQPQHEAKPKKADSSHSGCTSAARAHTAAVAERGSRSCDRSSYNVLGIRSRGTICRCQDREEAAG